MDVLRANPHSLWVRFCSEPSPIDGFLFDTAVLSPPGRRIELGPCRYEAGSSPKEGRLVFTGHVYDFRSLFKSGTLLDVEHQFRQLSLLLGYKEHIHPAFRAYTADLKYDIQIFRMLFDGIDRGLRGESAQTKEEIRSRVIDQEGRQFFIFLDEKIAEMDALVTPFSRIEHERHGFYFRKQVWDVILCSTFMARTNMRPRGYAGDSEMMRQIYENRYLGEGLFSRLMHKHPVESAAAQAVRNRRALIPREVASVAASMKPAGSPMRFMSVACGPAWELQDVFGTSEDLDRYECVLLDQDPDALADARESVEAVERRLQGKVRVSFVEDSVRTMLRAPDLTQLWGRFHFVYTLGLFDYLNESVARAVLTRLYSLLHPGGRLLVGNFHVLNPTRYYMAYWMDWMLIYRTEEEIVALAAACEGADCSVEFESTRSQMFLSIRKPA